MSALVTDTHALLWFLDNSPQLSAAARKAMETAESTASHIHVPSIVLVEVRYLVEKRTLTERNYQAVLTTLTNPNTALSIVPLDLDVADSLRHVPRDIVPDMPDRIIAATALALGVPLVTRDTQIARSSVNVIW